MTRGWRNESHRHSLSAKGIKTSPDRMKASGEEWLDELWVERAELMHSLADQIVLPSGWKIKWSKYNKTSFELEIFDLDSGEIGSIHVDFNPRKNRAIGVRSSITRQKMQSYSKLESALEQIHHLLDYWVEENKRSKYE